MAQLKDYIQGDKELLATLQNLKKNCVSQIMRPAINEGLKPIQEQAKESAKPGNTLSNEASGLMRRAIKRVTRISRDGIRAIGKIFVDRKTKGIVNGKVHIPGNIAHLVEFGHGGPSPAEAHPFMRPALDEKKQEGLEKVVAKAKEMLLKIVEKYRSKGKDYWK